MKGSEITKDTFRMIVTDPQSGRKIRDGELRRVKRAGTVDKVYTRTRNFWLKST